MNVIISVICPSYDTKYINTYLLILYFKMYEKAIRKGVFC
jgi:hypothetical protein